MSQIATVADTSLSQPIPERPEATIFAKPYRDVRLGDEINAFCGRTYRRCKVIGREEDGAFVRLTLTLATRASKRDIAVGRFLQRANAEVYLDRTPTQLEALQRHQEWLLAVIQPGRIYTLMQLSEAISDRLGKRAGKYNLSKAGRQLAKRGLLYCRKVGASAAFRAPLPRVKNLAVVEFAGKPQERLGWIVEWRHFHATHSLQPVVHFLDGHEAFSNEDRLDPATAEQSKRIEVARLRHEGVPIEGLIDLSDLLLFELRESWSDRQSRNEVMVHIAHLLGFLPADATDFQGMRKAPAWNETLDYLETYYPGWQQGMRRAG